MSKREFIACVQAFMAASGDLEDVPNTRTVARYTGMQLEELAEKLEALGLTLFAEDLQSVGREFKAGAFDELVRHALRSPATAEAMLDADVDLAWVSIAGSLAAGAAVVDAGREVSASNLSKIGPDGSVQRDANGKIVKPAHFVRPDLRPFIHPSIV